MSYRPVHVSIIGGGFSGTMLAVQLLRRDSSLRIAIVEKNATAGTGVAYSTADHNHFLNVPAGNMSAFPDDCDHLLRWARENYDAAIQVSSFLPRNIYGRYLVSLLESAMAQSGSRLQVLHDQVLSLDPGNGVTSLRLTSGSELHAQTVVLALGNAPPPDLNIPGLTAHATHCAPSAWSGSALENIAEGEDVLLVGSGLTSVDMAIALHARGFTGRIHVISRRGLLPQTHGFPTPWSAYSPDDFPRTVRGILRLIRSEAERARKMGSDWRSVVAAIRPVTTDIWHSLPLPERKRFLRHLRPYWDVHRHCIAPEVGEKLAAMISQGQLHAYAGRLTGYCDRGDSAEITFRERKTRIERTLRVARVINCTGSESDCRRTKDPLLKSLIAQGMVRPDSLFLGLDTDANGAVLASTGVPSSCLYTIGTSRKGSLWESVAVPELRVQATQLAAHLAHRRQNPRFPFPGEDSGSKSNIKKCAMHRSQDQQETYVYGKTE